MTEEKQTTADNQVAADSEPVKVQNSTDNSVTSLPEDPKAVSDNGSDQAAAETTPAELPVTDAPAAAVENGEKGENGEKAEQAEASDKTEQVEPEASTDSASPQSGPTPTESSQVASESEATAESEPAATDSEPAPVNQDASDGQSAPEAVAETEAEDVVKVEQEPVAAAPAETTRIRFAELNLDKRLHKAIESIGFEFCTPIQAETLPYTLACHDLIGQAQTGTGKTAAFLITAIQTMLETPIPDQQRFASEPRVLALAPTRELAMQIAKDAEELCRHTGHRVVSVVGGMNYDKQRDQLQNEIVDILVATPGRLIDFLGSQDVFLDQLDLLILDEADRMLDMGFIPDVKRIIRRCTPKEDRQTLLFSATFNQDVLNLASMWTQGAEFIEIEPQQKTAERVKQTVYLVSDDDKLTVLVNCLKDPGVEKAIVFANRRDQCRDLDEDLRNQGVKVALMSGEIAQNKRLKTLDQFKRGDIQVLVATDVAGRGIHVDGVTHVFNYNLPENAEDYVHRIGRTGRAGQNGISISFAGEDDAFALPAIESYISQKLTTAIPQEELMAPLDKPKIQRRRGRRPQGGGQGGAGRGRPRPRRN